MSTPLKALRKEPKMDSDEQPLSGYYVRVGAALDLLEKVGALDRVILKGVQQTDSNDLKYSRRWKY